MPGGAVCGSPDVYPLIWGGDGSVPLMQARLAQQQKCQHGQDGNREHFFMKLFKPSLFAALPKEARNETHPGNSVRGPGRGRLFPPRALFWGQHLWGCAVFAVAGEENVPGTRWLGKKDAASSS